MHHSPRDPWLEYDSQDKYDSSLELIFDTAPFCKQGAGRHDYRTLPLRGKLRIANREKPSLMAERDLDAISGFVSAKEEREGNLVRVVTQPDLKAEPRGWGVWVRRDALVRAVGGALTEVVCRVEPSARGSDRHAPYEPSGEEVDHLCEHLKVWGDGTEPPKVEELEDYTDEYRVAYTKMLAAHYRDHQIVAHLAVAVGCEDKKRIAGWSLVALEAGLMTPKETRHYSRVQRVEVVGSYDHSENTGPLAIKT